ncbi:MAG: preprotein translocase subunit SecE [Oscillospiraceae bacterium]|jgi:preprotein translocase subunit SecE
MSKAKEDAVKKVTTTEAVKKPTGNEKLKTSQRISKWWRELKAELKKVVWPTRKQTMTNTSVAIVVTVVSAVVLWGFDSLASLGVRGLLSLVG